jgi:hypothetical protein
MNSEHNKPLFFACFIASLVFLFVALFVVHPRGGFGSSLTILAVAATVGCGRAFFKAPGQPW